MKNQNSILSNAIQILDENRLALDEPLLIKEYYESQKNNDPTFFNWLFPDAGNIEDFGGNMSSEQIKAFEDFENSINSLDDIRENYQL